MSKRRKTWPVTQQSDPFRPESLLTVPRPLDRAAVQVGERPPQSRQQDSTILLEMEAPTAGVAITRILTETEESTAAGAVNGKPVSDDTNVRVTPNNRPQNEPSVAVNPLNPAIVVAAANDYRQGDSLIGLYSSLDGGETFTNRILPPPPGFATGGDPVIDAGFGSLFLLVGLTFNRPVRDGTVVLYRSLDDGEIFSEPIVINRGFGVEVFNDKPYLAIDRSGASPFLTRAYVSYTRFFNNFSGTMIFFQRSTDQGMTWSDPVPLSAPGDLVQGSSIAVGANGEVYVAWIHFGPGRPRFCMRRSDDGGVTFGPAVTVAPVELVPLVLPVPEWAFRVLTFSFIGTDISTGPARGSVYALWHDFRSGSAHILLSRSIDRGDTWSAPVRVNDSPPKSQNFFPFITVARETGTLKVIYYTNRRFRTLLDVFVAESGPEEPDFGPNRRVTAVAFDPNADPAFGVPSQFIGDYIWAQVQGQRLLAVWTDTRTGSQDIFAGNGQGN